MGVIDDLNRAREAYERRDWVRTYRSLSEVEDTALAAQDFLALATTAYLLGRHNDCVQALQRAFQAYHDGGDRPGAVRATFWLGLVLVSGGEPAVGGGWVARGERLLQDVPGDLVERGYLLVHRMFRHIGAEEIETASALAEEITDYGRRFHDPDLLALGLNAQGRLLTACGRVPEGLARLDEAMVGVVTGEVTPIIAGQVYCSMIEACQWIGDFGRVGQWTHALTEWCDRQPGLVAFTGQCAVHRGQLMKLHGRYRDALAELDRAGARYAATGGGPAVGLAHRERGDVLRLLGEHAAADAAFDDAARQGSDVQPERALLWTGRGRTDAAVAAVRRLVAEAEGPVRRCRALPGVVEVLVAAGEVALAATLAEELARTAESFDCVGVTGAASVAAAQVRLAGDDAEGALAASRAAVNAWSSLAAPYEVARSRMLRGRALRMLGDEESAEAELSAARNAFAALGAVPAEREATALLGAVETPGGLSPREVEVLRLVAAGRTNPEIAAALVLSEKTVARHLSNIFTKLEVTSRTSAAAFAYEHHLV